MAIPIRSVPVLEGEVARRFIKEAKENEKKRGSLQFSEREIASYNLLFFALLFGFNEHIAITTMKINPFFALLVKRINLCCIRTAANCFENFVCSSTFVDDLNTDNSAGIFLFTYKHGANLQQI